MWLSMYRAYWPTRKFGGTTTKEMKRLAEYENDLVFQNIFSTLVNVALNLFEWENTPDTVDDRFFEEMLLFMGQACFVKDPEYGDNAFLSLPCVQASSQNIYYENPVYRAFSLSYNKEFLAMTDYNKDIIKKLSRNFTIPSTAIMQGCVCFDNEIHYPMIRIIEMYAQRIAKTIRDIDVVQNQLKVPRLIGTTAETKDSIQQAVNNVDMNVLALYVEPAIKKALSEASDIDLGANPQSLVELWNSLNNWWSQALTALGVNNLNTSDKKERLLTDEVNSNDQFITLNSAYRLDMRLHFCEHLNEVFGLNVSCKMRHEFEQETEQNSMNDKSAKNRGADNSGSDV